MEEALIRCACVCVRLMVRPSHISQQGGETLYQFSFHRSAGLKPACAGITLNTLQDRITSPCAYLYNQFLDFRDVEHVTQMIAD